MATRAWMRFLLMMALALPLAPASGTAAELGARLDELLAYAKERNPELMAKRQAAEAEALAAQAADALPDPRFQTELMDVNNAINGGGATLIPGQVGETRYRLIQPLPFWGVRDLRGGVARARAGQSDWLAKGAWLELAASIKKSFARHYQAGHQLRVIDEMLALMDAQARLTEKRYGLGLAPQQEALQAQSEITAVNIERLETLRRQREAAAQLNALLPRAADAPLAAAAALPAPLPPDALALPRLVELARAHSPDIASQRLAIEAATQERELAHKNRYPDFAVGLTNNRPRGGINSWDVMLEMSIPLQQSSRRQEEGAAQLRVDAQRQRLEAELAKLDGRIGEALAAYAANRDKARLLRETLLPQVLATLASAQAAYANGKLGFTTLIDIDRQILRARLGLIEAEAEAAQRQAELEQLSGREN